MARPTIGARILPALLIAIGVSGCAKIPTGSGAIPSDGIRAPRTVSFSGYDWQVKSSGGVQVGPGPNYFSDDPARVFVDSAGRLHLKIVRQGFDWQCAEVVLGRSLGYGRYTFTLDGDVAGLDRNAVLGLFTWDTDAPAVHNREIDIEISRWSVASNENAQFVVQPYTQPGNIFRFELPASRASAHVFTWTESAVSFESRHQSGMAATWIYRGADVPAPGAERARINLWLFGGAPPAERRDVEVVVSAFSFARE